MEAIPGTQFSKAAIPQLGSQRPDDLSAILGGVETCGMEVRTFGVPQTAIIASLLLINSTINLRSPRTLASE